MFSGCCRSGAKEVEVLASLSSVPVPLHMSGGSIVAMHDFEQRPLGSLVTAQVRRSPLTLVLALKHPVVGASPAEEGTQTAEGFMFLDDGESIHTAGAAACNFLKFSARVVQQGGEQSSLGKYYGEVNISFGVPEGFAAKGAMADAEVDPASCQGFEWPELQKVKVLGWQMPVSEARLQVLQQAEDAAAKVSTGLQWNVYKHLEFTIPEGSRALKDPLQLALSWSSAAAAVGDEALLVEGKLHKEPKLASALF